MMTRQRDPVAATDLAVLGARIGTCRWRRGGGGDVGGEDGGEEGGERGGAGEEGVGDERVRDGGGEGG